VVSFLWLSIRGIIPAWRIITQKRPETQRRRKTMSQIQDDGRDEYEMEATRAPNRGSGKLVAFLVIVIGVGLGVVAHDFNTGVVAGIWVVLLCYTPRPGFNWFHGLVVVMLTVIVLSALWLLGASEPDRLTIAFMFGCFITAVDSALIRARR
jgi:cell division protein FtsW (lipid II flippase)